MYISTGQPSNTINAMEIDDTAVSEPGSDQEEENEEEEDEEEEESDYQGASIALVSYRHAYAEVAYYFGTISSWSALSLSGLDQVVVTTTAD